jgi:SAM-dependent methyltransferase
LNPSCALCQGPASFRFAVDGYRIHRCPECDLEFVHPLPSPSEIAAVYERGYFSGGGHGYGDYLEAERSSNRRKAAARLGRLFELGLGPGERLLDVGCADGTFVEQSLQRGLDAYGVEVSEEIIPSLPEQVRPRVRRSLEAAAPLGPYHAVTFWDVLEHLPDPIATLRAARALLRPGGLLAAVVPVIDNINARAFPRSWDQYKPPEHLWYFSRASLRAVVEREIGGVVLEEGAWQRPARVFDVALASRRALAAPRWLERQASRALLRLGVLPRRWAEDSVAVYARVDA